MTQETTRPPKRRRRWLRRIGWTLLVLVALGVVVRVVAGYVTQRMLNTRLEALRASGEPLRLAELAPPEIPAERNAATLYAQAFVILDTLPKDARRRMRSLTKDAPLSDAEIGEARAVLGQSAEAVRLTRDAAERPECRFPVRYDFRPAQAILLPHLAGLQDAERLLALSCRVSLADGKPDAAAADCLAMFRMARATENEPILISMLVENAMAELAARRLEEVLSRAEPSAEALAQFPAPRPEAEARERFRRAMRGERCMGIDAFQGVIDGSYSVVPREGETSPSAGRRSVSATIRPFFLSDFAHYLDVMNEYVGATCLPRREARERWRLATAALDAEGRNFRLSRIVSHFLLPALRLSDDAFARALACERLMFTAIALRRFRIDRGRYPDTLAELVPQFLTAVPEDPFTGTNLIYRREGQGFVVYSLGLNGTDEGGVEGRTRDQGDMVWRLSR